MNLTAQPVDVLERRNSPGKSRFRFSLRWLIVGTAFLAVVLSHVTTSLDLRQSHLTMSRQESELKKLRAELGVSEISEPTRAHVLFVPQRDEQSWRWRVYLPPNRNYNIRWMIDGIPSEGLSKEWEGQGFLVFPDDATFTLDAFVRKGADGNWKIYVRHPRGELRRDLPGDHPLVEPQEPVVLETHLEGLEGVATADVRQPLVLFRYRIIPQSEHDAALQQDTKTYPGVMIWLEPAK